MRLSFRTVDTYAALATLTVVTALSVARIVPVLNTHIWLKGNEGWNAYHSVAAMSGGLLYPGQDGLFFNNYPPLSYYLVGLAGRLNGDIVVAGRVLSLIAFLAVTGLIFGLTRRMGCANPSAALAGLTFAAPMAIATGYVGINEPQLVGHAISLAAVPIVWREPRRPAAIVVAALLLTLGVFVKHNLIVLPLAVLVWLLLFDRPAARWLLLSGAILGAVGLGFCFVQYGANLVDQILSPRPYSLLRAAFMSLEWLKTGCVALALAAIALVLAPRDRHAIFCEIYAVIAIILGGLWAGGDGVNVNILFDATIALAMTSGLVMKTWPAVPRLLYVVPVVVQVVAFADASWFTLNPYAERQADTARVVAILRERPAPVVCQSLVLCFWAGQPATVDLVGLRQRYRLGSRDEQEFIAWLDAHRFTAIQLYQRDQWPFSPRVRQALEQSYSVEREDSTGVLLLPRSRVADHDAPR